MSQLYQLYKASDNEEFTRNVCEIAPYFSTIDPLFQQLKPGYAEVTMPNTPKVHNHLGTVHAIAMCNLAEIAAGIMTDISIPDSYHWIPIGMHAQYNAKATTDLCGIADGAHLDWQTPGDKDVPVSILNTEGREVCRVFIKVRVGIDNGK